MGWTDDRVDILKKLWMKGLSASQIAGELGQGVTRNAVIGKVHRLKLAARVKPATSSARARTTARMTRRPAGAASSGFRATKRRSVGSAPIAGATALKPSEVSEEELKIAREEANELHIPVDERVSLLELNEQKCKWPIGDPLGSDFYFCGRNSLEAKPYCEFHSRRAYHKVERKKRQ